MNLRKPAGAAALCTLIAASAILAGCGKSGALERPGPLFGQGRSTTRQADEATRQAQDPNRPVDTIDPRDNQTDPAPPRTLPIPGSGQDPFAQPPPTNMPNPYANPR
jgi:hypothetical protein